MTREEAKAAAAVMMAYADGKAIEWSHRGCNDWKNDGTSGTLSFDWDCRDYRIAPKPKLRPWTAEEVPLNAAFRHGKDGYPTNWFDIRADAIKLGIGTGIDYHWKTLLDSWQHSTDGGKTWQPCGVMEAQP